MRLQFTKAGGERSGLGPNGRRAGSGAGLIERSGEVTPHAIPAGQGTMSVTSDGSGPATVVVLGPGPRTLLAQTMSFTVRPGQSGSVPLSGGGSSGPLRIGGRPVPVRRGLPLSIPARSSPAGRSGVELRVTSLGATVAGAEVTAAGRTRVAAVTDRDGAAKLRLPSGGRVVVDVTAPGYRTLRRTIFARSGPKSR